MIGSVLVHATESLLALTRLDLTVDGLESPTGDFDVVRLPCSDALVGRRTRLMLELPEIVVADDAPTRMSKYSQVARALGREEVYLLDMSPYLLVSALGTHVEVSRFARRSPRGTLRNTSIGDLALDVSDVDLGRVIRASLAP
jgi:hypothetical protein